MSHGQDSAMLHHYRHNWRIWVSGTSYLFSIIQRHTHEMLMLMGGAMHNNPCIKLLFAGC
jgi:hypothetical protein